MDRMATMGRLSLKEVAIERIKTAIFEGEFQPGERLNDAQLQTWLGISRSPLREALSELTRIGLIETAPQRFTRVATADATHIDDHIQLLGTLLGGIVRVTVPSLTDNPPKAQLLASIDSVIDTAKNQNTLDFVRTSKDLMNQLVALCPNVVLVTFVNDILDATTYLLGISNAVDHINWEISIVQYQKFRRCVEANDAIGAEQAIEDLYRLPH